MKRRGWEARVGIAPMVLLGGSLSRLWGSNASRLPYWMLVSNAGGLDSGGHLWWHSGPGDGCAPAYPFLDWDHCAPRFRVAMCRYRLPHGTVLAPMHRAFTQWRWGLVLGPAAGYLLGSYPGWIPDENHCQGYLGEAGPFGAVTGFVSGLLLGFISDERKPRGQLKD